MEEVIERLTKSKESAEANSRSEGRRFGTDWAKRHAEYDGLRRLDQFEFNRDFWTCAGDHELLNALARIIDPECDDYRSSREFWEAQAGEDYWVRYGPCEEEFARGFLDGAIEVWNAVRGSV